MWPENRNTSFKTLHWHRTLDRSVWPRGHGALIPTNFWIFNSVSLGSELAPTHLLPLPVHTATKGDRNLSDMWRSTFKITDLSVNRNFIRYGLRVGARSSKLAHKLSSNFCSSAKREQEKFYFFGDKVSERLPEPEMRSEGLWGSLKIEVSGIVCVNVALECII